ncbi:MAG: VWA domain-containing protein [Chitinophagaceae bacterium]
MNYVCEAVFTLFQRFMAFRRFIFCFLLLFPLVSSAQVEQSKEKTPRVLFLLDGSSSMAEDWTSGKTRFQQARTFILTLLDSLSAANDKVEFGLRVFGHQYPAQERNCYDTKLEIGFSRYSGIQMSTRLESLHGYGVSPIAYSLSEAAMEDFENESKYAYSIILVTDGGESCDGDICQVVNKLLQRKIFFKPYIVSLVDYAPLKDMYACLGTFLTVSNAAQQTPVISKIVDGHREGFIRAKTGAVIPVMPVTAKPETPKPAVPSKPAVIPDTIRIPIQIRKTDSTQQIVPVQPRQEIPKPAPAPRKKENIQPLRLKSGKRTFKVIQEAVPPAATPVPVRPFLLSAIGNRPPEPPKPVLRTALKPLPAVGGRKPRNMRLLTVIPSPKQIPVHPMELTKFVKETPAVVATPAPAPVKATPTPTPATAKPAVAARPTPTPAPVKPALAPANYTQEKTPADQTLVEVVFTDGNGRFYSTTPQIQLSDPATNKPVKLFYRTVDENGNPDPVQVQAGVYNLSVVGSDKTFLKSVEIVAKTRNKITITVSSGSLKFVWRGGTNKEPVSKYFAQVKRNFVPQPMVTQRCDTVMPYPPGNYHIEINTVPVSVRSVDLTFGATVIIPIDEPGIVQVTNTETLGKATLYYQLGDKFMQFSALNIIGNPGSQTMELLPGLYEIHYTLGAGLPEKVVAFHVYATKTTSLELK